MGISRPGDMGFDIVHFNLHKSFTQPHGGGGPGAGPIAVSERIEPYLPRPAGRAPRAATTAHGRRFDLDYDRPKSIGRLRGFQGNYGVFVRSYAYIRSLGRRRPAGGLRDRGAERQLPAGAAAARRAWPSTCRSPTTALCMHEFVLSGAPMKRELGIKTLDLAKRLLDHGFHPPTVYFPLLVDEALLIEPTETETKETLDALRRRDRGDPARGRRGPGDRAQRAVHDAGAPAGRGRRGEAAGHPPGAVALRSLAVAERGCAGVEARASDAVQSALRELVNRG